jgi:toxin ParE1/3/4
VIVRLLAEAKAEANDAAAWYDERQPGLGAEFLDALGGALEAIEKDSGRFAKVHSRSPKRDVRRCILWRFPFSVVFERRLDEIIVLAVAHARRRPNYWRRRKG